MFGLGLLFLGLIVYGIAKETRKYMFVFLLNVYVFLGDSNSELNIYTIVYKNRKLFSPTFLLLLFNTFFDICMQLTTHEAAIIPKGWD